MILTPQLPRANFPGDRCSCASFATHGPRVRADRLFRSSLAPDSPCEYNTLMNAITMLPPSVRHFANPWPWSLFGLACIAAACVFSPSDRLPLVVAGLICVVTSLSLRLGKSGPAFLTAVPPILHTAILLALTLLFAGIAVGLSGLLVVAFMRPGLVPWRFGPILFCWIIMAVPSELAMMACVRRLRQKEPLEAREESALLLALAGLACFAANWVLRDRGDPLSMDTIRMFLGVFTVVAFIASPLALVTESIRRKIISVMILFHFAGIASATMIMPSPVAAAQYWSHISRPYLEFLFLTNAYHFYAPNPNPAMYLWFRVEFEAEEEGKESPPGEWYKVPQVDEKGRTPYAMGVDLQRFLCLTDNTIGAGPVDNFLLPNGAASDVFWRRLQHVPPTNFHWEDLDTADRNLVPWSPDASPAEQRQIPNEIVRLKILPAYIRRVAALDTWGDKKVKGVKLYRVVHNNLTTEHFRMGIIGPGDPDTYYGIYLGDYDTKGNLVNPDDDLLYWALPTIREAPLPGANIRCFTRRHAGDPLWIYAGGKWKDK